MSVKRSPPPKEKTLPFTPLSHTNPSGRPQSPPRRKSFSAFRSVSNHTKDRPAPLPTKLKKLPSDTSTSTLDNTKNGDGSAHPEGLKGKLKGIFSRDDTSSLFSKSTDKEPSEKQQLSKSGGSTSDFNKTSTAGDTITPATSRDPLKVTINPPEVSVPNTQPGQDRSTKLSDSVEFRNTVTRAEKTVDRLSTTLLVLQGVAGALELGAGWLPGVGKGVSLIVDMLASAKTLSLGKVVALRLVERCASVLNAVQQAVIDNKGRISPVNEKNVNVLIENLDDTAAFMTKLSQRPFLKLYLHMDDTQRQITKATEDLDDFIKMFEIQSLISTAAWQEESRNDHERDLELLLLKQEETRKDDQALLKMLEIKADQQQEAIKTLQRTLDTLLAHQTQQSRAISISTTVSSEPISQIDQQASQVEEDASIQSTSKAHISSSRRKMLLNRIMFARPRSPDDYGSKHTRVYQQSATGTVDKVEQEARDSDVQELSKLLKVRLAVPDSPESMDLDEKITTKLGKLENTSSFDDIHTLRRMEFCERALDVLRRHSSADTDVGVPDWTITPLEVSHDQRVNTGFFSEIWKGRWQGRQVAIKQLNPATDRNLFVHEVDVWRQLRSDHILPFYGASSTTGPPPWFLVSPYMQNGDVLKYLASEAGEVVNKVILLHQTAEGMEYLHGREILHGDLKASNVLVDEDGRAIICDFGLSKLKLDISTRSQQTSALAHALGGTMRWQSPERLNGSPLNAADDVYAFGITMCELYLEQVPYGYVDDFVLRKSILTGKRPSRPPNMPQGVWDLCQRCWATSPVVRPKFTEIAAVLGKMYTAPQSASRKGTLNTVSATQDISESYMTAEEEMMAEDQRAISPQMKALVLPEVETSSSSGSIQSIPPHLEKEPSFDSDRAERHYRHYLTHDFDDRLTLPLWFPSAVALGEVGYIRHGQFIKLLDAHRLSTTTLGLPPMPYLDEFSSLQTDTKAVNVRNAAEKGLDYVSSLTNFIRSSGEQIKESFSRRIPFPLKPGMKQAGLIVDDGEFEIYKSFSEARSYLVANIDWILSSFSETHHISKEDVIIVVGTLRAANYAMVVSNFAPRTTLTFNVHAKLESGKPWGTWSVNRQPHIDPTSRAFRASSAGSAPSAGNMPGVYGPRTRPEVDEQELKYNVRVSTVSASPKDAVLLAKLRFAPGSADPALYP